MKKSTMMNLVNCLNELIGINGGEEYTKPELVAARDELEAELNKGAEIKAKNAEAYEALHDVIMENLGEAPCTVAELWDAIKDDVPEGTTKGKVQYALTHLWQDEIVKVEGKPNGYRKA